MSIDVTHDIQARLGRAAVETEFLQNVLERIARLEREVHAMRVLYNETLVEYRTYREKHP
jgi:hypothetical protein